MTAIVYSERLGAITDEQFAAAATRLGLGAFVSAAPAASGLFGQNVFLTTGAGQFVLRGAPHWVMGRGETQYRPQDLWQFTKEAFFAHQMAEHTQAPSPWPYLLDETSDIFGWPYAIMPRMPGDCFDERTILKALAPDDRRHVAAAMGTTLAELQRLTSPFAGDLDVDTMVLTPDPGGYVEHVITQTDRLAEVAWANGAMTPADLDWIAAAARHARTLALRPNTFVHGDYKLNNVTVARDGDAWRVSGVFDLHTARFGDGAYDLLRQACAYLDTENALAQTFVDAYRKAAQDPSDPSPWIPLYGINERLALWQAFVRADARPAWGQGKTFRDWAEPYLTEILARLVKKNTV